MQVQRSLRGGVAGVWGEFDLSATRYSGQLVTPPSTMPVVQQNGMAGEEVALGFALGDKESPAASFFAYVAPPPGGIETADFAVKGAAYVPDAGLISLPWEVVRASDDPKATIVRFGDAVYEAASELGGWPNDLTGPRHDGWWASTNLVFG